MGRLSLDDCIVASNNSTLEWKKYEYVADLFPISFVNCFI